MTFRPTTIERAYQLAKSGSCRTVSDVKDGLRSEGYANVQDHLHGPTIARALRSLCDAHYSQTHVPA